MTQEIRQAIGTETPEFAVQAKRKVPLKTGIKSIVFSLLWLAFSSIFVFAFVGPVISGKEANITINDAPTTVGPGNYTPLILPGIIISVFVLIGLGILIHSIYSILSKGPIFIGTPTRLIILNKNSTRSIDWEQFSGDIEIFGNQDNHSINLFMRTGKMVSRKNGPDQYVPDSLVIAEISNAQEVEKIIRQRVKENDPTPTNTNIHIKH